MKKFLDNVSGGIANYKVTKEKLDKLSNGAFYPQNGNLVHDEGHIFEGKRNGLTITDGDRTISLNNKGSIKYS